MKILVLVIFLGACSQSYAPLSLESHDRRRQIRSLASDATTGCFLDKFDSGYLKEQIQTLEASRSPDTNAQVISRFSNLNPHEKEFLSKFLNGGATISSLEVNCEDLPCYINGIYKKRSDSFEGLAIYHHFLRAGYGVGLTATEPETKFNSNPLETILFGAKELKLFVSALETLPEEYSHMPLLKSIHSLKPGYKLGFSKGKFIADKNGEYAGLFRYSTLEYPFNPENNKLVAGHIVLTDERLEEQAGSWKGYLATVHLHEMTHALDASLAYRLENFSERAPWLNRDWKQYVLVDKDHTELAEYPASGEHNYVTKYAKSNSREDFAESGAYFFYNPDLLKQKAPNKFNFFKYKFYNGESYEKANLEKVYAARLLEGLESKLPVIISSCLDAGAKSHPSKSRVSLDFSRFAYLSDTAQSCINESLWNSGQEVLQSIRAKEYHACNYLSSQNEDRLYGKVYDKLNDTLAGLILNRQDLAELAQSWQDFRDELATRCNPKSLYLNIWAEEAGEQQYTKRLQSCAREIWKAYPTLSQLLPADLESYLGANTYASAAKATKNLFHEKLSRIKDEQEAFVSGLWDRCESEKNIKEEVYVPYHGGSLFLHSSVLACLNTHLVSGLNSLVADELPNASEQEIQYATKLKLNELIESISKYHQRKSDSERKQIASYLETLDLVVTYGRDREFLTQLPSSQDEAMKICQEGIFTTLLEQTQMAFPSLVATELPTLLGEHLQDTCYDIVAEKEKMVEREENQLKEVIPREIKNIVVKNETAKWVYGPQSDFQSICIERLSSELLSQGVPGTQELVIKNSNQVAKEIATQACMQLEQKRQSALSVDMKKISSLLEQEVESLNQNLQADLSWTEGQGDFEVACLSQSKRLLGPKSFAIPSDAKTLDQNSIKNAIAKKSCGALISTRKNTLSSDALDELSGVFISKLRERLGEFTSDKLGDIRSRCSSKLNFSLFHQVYRSDLQQRFPLITLGDIQGQVCEKFASDIINQEVKLIDTLYLKTPVKDLDLATEIEALLDRELASDRTVVSKQASAQYLMQLLLEEKNKVDDIYNKYLAELSELADKKFPQSHLKFIQIKRKQFLLTSLNQGEFLDPIRSSLGETKYPTFTINYLRAKHASVLLNPQNFLKD